MRILVTGGAGYIGSITVRTLLDAGHEVVVIDSLERGHAEAVDPRAELVIAPVGHKGALDSVLHGVDAVMHLAGLIEVAESQSEPARYIDANVAQPSVMLQAMIEHGVKAIVFSSTAAVYGEPEQVPIPEDAPTRPINAYGLSKLAFEHLLEWAAVTHGVHSVRFRYFNVAGAWPDGSLGEAHSPETHIVPRALDAIYRGEPFTVFGNDYPTPDGTCVRDYIHVCDLADAHRLALEDLGAIGTRGVGAVSGASASPAVGAAAESRVYNLGNGEGFSNLEVVRACAAAVGREVNVSLGARRPGDPARLVASSEAARRDLGWTPARADLASMMTDAWRWHVMHPDGYGS
ncbi:MAG: UDP-glucose 4-epimerase GalE [Coriobacteriia bacterium]|nr:UDP-glucose 4-epimerase GalE [Coriobacteriia bacterium]